jgi:hypothetical protein
MDTQDGAVTVDDDLRVEQRVAVGNTLRDAEVDGDFGASARVLDGTDVLAIRFHDHALLGILGQGANLFQRRVALGPVLRMIVSKMMGPWHVCSETWAHTGYPGINVSGNTSSLISLDAASSMSATVFLMVAALFMNTGAA